MRNFGSDERGISSIVGFLIVVAMLVGLGGYVLAVKGRQAGMQVGGLVDAMEDAEKRQRQLLTFVYSNEESNKLHAYLYNYGTEEVTVEKLWVNGEKVSPSDFDFIDSTENVFNSRKLTEVVVDGISDYAPRDLDNYPFTFLTETNSLYSYSIVREEQ